MVTDSNGEMLKVKVNDVLKDKDPLKDVLLCELLLNSDQTEILGIDLNGEIVVRKWSLQWRPKTVHKTL